MGRVGDGVDLEEQLRRGEDGGRLGRVDKRKRKVDGLDGRVLPSALLEDVGVLQKRSETLSLRELMSYVLASGNFRASTMFLAASW